MYTKLQFDYLKYLWKHDVRLHLYSDDRSVERFSIISCNELYTQNIFTKGTEYKFIVQILVWNKYLALRHEFYLWKVIQIL